MNTIKIVNKIATYSSVAAFVFTILEAALQYLAISIAYSGQNVPAEYIAISILTALVPYLLIGVIAALTAIYTKEPKEEAEEQEPAEEALTQTETEVNA